MQPFDVGALGRILAVRLDNVGDVVMLSPALRALRHAAPGATITAMLSPAGAQVAPMLPWVDDTIVCRAPWQDASPQHAFDPGQLAAISDNLRARQFDAAFIFTSFSQSPYPPAYACYLAGIPIRVGESKEFGGGILSHPVPALADSEHQTLRSLHLLSSVGVPTPSSALELRIPGQASEWAKRLLASCDITSREPYIVLAPGASCPARRYDPERFALAARLVSAATSMPVVVVGSERDEPVVATVMRAVEGGFANLCGETSVAELAAVIEGAALVLANDSGPMHIAEATGTPMVILYAGTELESQWRPRHTPSVLLRQETACSPCYAFECAHKMECLDIPAADVAAAAIDLLQDPAVLVRNTLGVPGVLA